MSKQCNMVNMANKAQQEAISRIKKDMADKNKAYVILIECVDDEEMINCYQVHYDTSTPMSLGFQQWQVDDSTVIGNWESANDYAIKGLKEIVDDHGENEVIYKRILLTFTGSEE